MIRFLLAAAAALFVTSSAKADTAYTFDNYPAEVTRTTGPVKPILERGTFSWMFRTRIRNAAAEVPPNFAGHYILEQWGCGSSCQMGALIDALTGKVYELPLSAWGVDYRIDSNLLIVNPIDPEDEFVPLNITTEYFVWTGSKFQEIHSVKVAPRDPSGAFDASEASDAELTMNVAWKSMSPDEAAAYRSSCASRTDPLISSYFHGDPAEMAFFNADLIGRGMGARQKIDLFVEKYDFPRECLLEVLRFDDDTMVTNMVIVASVDVIFTHEIGQSVWEWPDLHTFGHKFGKEPSSFIAVLTADNKLHELVH